ncbi:WD40 repeat domain-containing serine/threonine protein kinase [Streptomyces avermitilis]
MTKVHAQGGMGLVYRVHHLGWDVDLAVKSPRPALIRHPDGRLQFVTEAQTWMALDMHPHVCTCYYVRTIDDVPRVFAEYAHGGSLRELIDSGQLHRGDPADRLTRLLDLAIQTAWGLEHAHRRGVVHRDVKPANVLLGTDGTAKVTDFGLARVRDTAVPRQDGLPMATTLVSAGGFTPAYASPEQLAGNPVGRRTDVWSFALSVLDMCAGGVTWTVGRPADTVLAAHAQNGILPAPLADLLGRCLRQDPARRPASMAAIADELRDIYAETAHRPYPRATPELAELRADELNNRALSLLDLGDATEAEAAFAAALRVDPNHLEATFNSGLLRWRSGEISDERLVADLSAARADARDRWQGAYLLGQVHLERGDLDGALPLLAEAARAVPDDREVAHTLSRARAGELADARKEQRLAGGTGRVTATAISQDIQLAVVAREFRKPLRRTLWTFLFGQARPSHQRVHVSDTAGGGSRHVWEGHDPAVFAADVSADGHRAATGDADGRIRLWDVDTGQCLRVLTGHTGYLFALRFSGDGRLLASAGANPAICVWDVATGTCLHVPDRDSYSWVRSVSFSTDGKILASAHERDTIRLWDLRTGSCIGLLEHPGQLHMVELSADAKTAVTCGEWATRVWSLAPDLSGGDCRHEFAARIQSLSLSGDGRLALASSGGTGQMWLWDLASGRCLRTFDGQQIEAVKDHFGNTSLSQEVRISTDGLHAMSVANGDVATTWGLPRGYAAPLYVCRPRPHTQMRELEVRVHTLLDEAEQALAQQRYGIALDRLSEARMVPGYERDSSVVTAWQRLSLATTRTGLRSAWLTRTLKVPDVVPGSFWYPAVRLSADGRYALTTHPKAAMVLWDLDTGRTAHTYTDSEQPIYAEAIDMTPDASHALCVDGYRTVQWWDLRDGRRLRNLGRQNSTGASVSLSRAGTRGLSVGGDGVPWFWDTMSGRKLGELMGPTEMMTMTEGARERKPVQVNHVCLSAHGKLALVALQSGQILRWDTVRQRQLPPLTGHERRVDTVVMSGDARTAVSGGLDGTVRHWDLATGQCVQVLEGHISPVSALDITADGRFALSGSTDQTARIWDLHEGRCLQVLEGHTGAVAVVSLSEDGRHAATASHNGTVWIWGLDWELAAHEAADWDKGARPYLDMFLDEYGPDLSAFDRLLDQLPYAGYGWLRPEGVRAELMRTAKRRDGWRRRLRMFSTG